jgi:curved DNA-binding protein CbpA
MGTDPLEEEVDIDVERRKWVLGLHVRLQSLTHYELLDVPRDADKKAIKRAYFNLAAKLHPDRYFGKKLGTYRARMEALFSRLTEAYDTLLSVEQRAAYDQTLGAAVPSARPRPTPLDAQQKAALDALKQKLGDGKAKAQEHIRAGERAKAAGDFVAAAQAYRMALLFLPQDQALKAAHAEMEGAAAQRLGESHKKKAQLEERHGHWAAAVESWKRALVAFPGDAEIETRLAAALSRVRTPS